MTQESRFSFVAKGVGAFFGFLLLFFGDSAHLGGGITGIAVSVVLAMVVAVGLVVLWPRLRGPAQDAPIEGPVRSTNSGPVCSPGPYAITSVMPTKIGLNVEDGSRLRGYVQEIDGDFFDWYIVDEDNMLRFLKGKMFDCIDGEENAQASEVKCRMPHAGPWYLLLDLANRRYDRKVEVNLRVL